jgi:hypothetical protein
MVKLAKIFGKNKNKIVNILLILAVVVLAGVLFKYNNDKSLLSDNMSNNPFANAGKVNETPSQGEAGLNDANPSGGVVTPVSTTDGDSFLNVNGLSSGKATNTNCNNQPTMDPKELLPSDSNNEWSNMLNSGHHIGVNTVGSSLRNANLQIRSEPVIPQNNVGPWNNTTIEPDNLRRNLEIGGSE